MRQQHYLPCCPVPSTWSVHKKLNQSWLWKVSRQTIPWRSATLVLILKIVKDLLLNLHWILGLNSNLDKHSIVDVTVVCPVTIQLASFCNMSIAANTASYRHWNWFAAVRSTNLSLSMLYDGQNIDSNTNIKQAANRQADKQTDRQKYYEMDLDHVSFLLITQLSFSQLIICEISFFLCHICFIY